MITFALLSLAAAQAPLAPLPPAVIVTPDESEERAARPAAPYSLPPVSTQQVWGSAPLLIPPGAPAAVEQRGTPLDDAIPLPVPAVVRETSAGDVVDAPASGDPWFLGFAAGPHRPPAGELVDARLYDGALASYPDGRPEPETYAFVMFTARMTEGRLAQLESAGCRLLGFHPHYTQKVALPSSSIDAVAALPFVRWIGVPQPWQKVHPNLSSSLVDAPANAPVDVWISVYESDVGPASVRRTVAGAEAVDPTGAGGAPGQAIELRDVWITNGWQQEALAAVGVEVLDFAGRVDSFRARILPQGLDLVTALDFVQFVELDAASAPRHDETMPMVNADYVRNYFDGGTSSRAVAGIVDTGVENSHLDLNHTYGVGWDLSGATTNPGAFNDTCGHGTHVAGTMFGNGDNEAGHRGAAPGLGWGGTGRIFNVRIFDSCLPQAVDEATVLGLISAPYTGTETTPIPHVINNSWGTPSSFSSPWVGSETECQLYDDNAYSDAQLNVFAAGNTGSAAASITLQATAKNVLAVGSAIDYSSTSVGLPGSLWSSSSRGPTGDGRWKPNLTAPGRMVTSADASDVTGYVAMSGTSMAAPHVTGIAADLIDSTTAFSYLPERITAHLMATSHAKDNALISTPSTSHLDQYGAGRVDATRAVWGSGGTYSHWAFSLNSGSWTFADFTVPAGATRLVAVMHYVETAASSGASKALVNDWDLYLDQPPIDPTGNSGEWFAQQSASDNTEIRVLSTPTAGTWRWKIWPESTSSTAYFGLSIYVQTSDDTPFMFPALTPSDTYVQPFDSVQMDYSLSTSGGSLSSVFLSGSPTGVLTASDTTLKDGAVTNLLGNLHVGWWKVLGNVDPFYSREASWDMHWISEGLESFCVTTSADNASNSGHVVCTSVIVDGTSPGVATNLTSTSHTAGVWSNDPTADLTWTASVDPLSGGTASGVDGYSHLILPTVSTPSATKTLGTVTSYTTPTLVSGPNYFNLRAVDRAGNWGVSTSYGPLQIDTVLPSPVTGLSSSTHAVGALSCQTSLTAAWSPSSDAHSGIQGYGASITSSPFSSAPTTVNAAGTSIVFNSLAAGTKYVHVRAIDNAGNAGTTAHLGPFDIDPSPVSTYCTSKVNSQGCLPTIGWLGSAPSASAGSGFFVTASNTLDNKSGLFFYGYTPKSSQFQGGWLCVQAPVKRTMIQNSGGFPPCGGLFTYDFNAHIASGIDPSLTAGTTVYGQYWSRDPASSFNTNRTDAIQMTICQ